MKRRDFLERAAYAAAAVGAAGSAAACGGRSAQQHGPARQTKQRVVWRLASSFPRSLDTIYGAAEVLADQVKTMSDGQFQIHCYPAGELVPGLQVLDAVQQGTVQLGHSASYYYTGKHPALAFDTSLPFGLSMRQQIAWLEEAGGGEQLAPLFAQFGIVRFLGGGTGAQMGGWFRKPIASPADIQGLKMRIPGLGGEVMSRLGATVQVLAGGDIYPALERGAIDATEWIGPYDDEKLGFQKIAKHYYYPGFWEPGPSLSFMVNQKEWDKLSAEHKAMFQAAAKVATLVSIARYDARNPAALQRLEQAGVSVEAFPDSVLSAAREKSEALIQEYASKDATYRKIYDHWNAFRKSAFEWFNTAENSYASFAMRG